MDWVAILFFVCVTGAFALGAWKFAQSPRFWVGLALEVLRRLLPFIKKYGLLLWAKLTALETEEDRKNRQAIERRGEEYNPVTKRPRDR